MIEKPLVTERVYSRQLHAFGNGSENQSRNWYHISLSRKFACLLTPTRTNDFQDWICIKGFFLFPPMSRYLHLWVSPINTCLDSKGNLETNNLFPKNPVPHRFRGFSFSECLFGQNGGPQPAVRMHPTKTLGPNNTLTNWQRICSPVIENNKILEQ